MAKLKSKHLVAALIITCIMLLVVRIGTREIPEEYTSSYSDSYIVYFAASDEVRLIPEYRIGTGTINECLQALIRGPQSTKLAPIMPPDTKIISYQLEANTLYVNFTEELIINHPGGSSNELITIYGLVNTMTEIPEIDQVQILVDGHKVETVAGHVDVLEPLTRDLSLIWE